MKKIFIADSTIKYSDNNGNASISFKEKIETIKLLDKINVSVIEIAPLNNDKISSVLTKTIVQTVKNSVVSIPVAFEENGVSDAWECIKYAENKRLSVVVPTSTVQMEYFFRKKPNAVMQIIKDTVEKCKKYTNDIEFVAADATRSEKDVLNEAIKTAISSGATTITLADTAGAMLPDEIGEFIKNLKNDIPELNNINLGVCLSNALNMANANAYYALKNGVSEIKCASTGKDIIHLEEISELIRNKGKDMDISSDLNITELKKSVKRIKWIFETKKSKNSPFENGVAENGKEEINIFEDDSTEAINKAISYLGYELSHDDAKKVLDAVKSISDSNKKSLTYNELDALIATTALQVPPTYELKSYVINSGNIISATAHIKITKNNELLEGIYIGDGPIDAAFLAIEQIIGHHYELDDFQIQAITEGREAMGRTIVRLRAGDGRLYSGSGISTDIIGASIKAYINALNKIAYEEN